MSKPQSMSTDEADLAMSELGKELAQLQRAIRIAIQRKLTDLVGRSMADLQQNKDLASTIHQLLDGHGLRIQCSECGHPAILRVSPRPGAASGVFVFDHTIEGRRTFHGGRITVPEIRLVTKPLRKKAVAKNADPKKNKDPQGQDTKQKKSSGNRVAS